MVQKSLSLSALLTCLLLIQAFSCQPAAAQGPRYPYTIVGEVVGVTDGDTIKVLRGKALYKVRLNGIDAPERKQAYGRKAKEFLSSLVFEKRVEVIVRDRDRYGRYVGDVMIGGKSASAELVAAGLAWQYVAYSKDRSLTALQMAARSRGIGLWADRSPLPPWEFRRKRSSGG
jgi:micrococcal nuclease